MRILFLSEYFPPFDFGGSEWSTYYLANQLAKKDFDVTIFTPKFIQAKSRETINGFSVVRFPLFIKFKGQPSPTLQNSLIWFFWTTYHLIKYCLSESVDIIHIQGKSFLPAAAICKLILRKPLVVTFRDYLILCPLGMCFLRGERKCDFRSFLFRDIPEYLEYYQKNKGFFWKILVVFSALRLRFYNYFIRGLVNLSDVRIANSYVTRSVYQSWGFKKITVIPNPHQFSKFSNNLKKKSQIIYAGRLSPGKGPDLLLNSIPKILNKFPKLKFLFFGEGPLKQFLIKKSIDLKIRDRVEFKGYIDHQILQNEIGNSLITVTPSKWLEPFGRVPLESISRRTPVVISENMGIADFINKRWGVKVKPRSKDIAEAVIRIVQKKDWYLNNLRLDSDMFFKDWNEKITNAHNKIYKRLSR